jgi:hypothetical protein
VAHMERPEVPSSVSVIVYGPSQDAMAGLANDQGEFAGPRFEDQDPSLPYEDRIKVEVPITPETRLGQVIDVAARQLGVTSRWDPSLDVSHAIPMIKFYPPRLPLGDGATGYYAIRTADESGTPSWTVGWRLIRMDELVRAQPVGAVEGDALRPCFWPCYDQGPPGPNFPHDLFLTWEALQKAIDAVTAFLGIREIRKATQDRVKGRVSKGKEVISSQWALPEWVERLGRPQDYVPPLSEGRTSDEAAEILRCQVEEAECLLYGMGFIRTKDGWKAPAAEDDVAARALFESIMAIRDSGGVPTEQELKALLRRLRK